ncbi:MAG: DUF4040 domain-containing protein [Anaerosomatales bacterium]|nr:DUF4040 domain-containing protein [Anaerosomatales bacterium]
MNVAVLDVMLCAGLVWCAVSALVKRDLFASIVMFISFGLLSALAWIRLAAPDIALAEAAIGAGATGALLLDAAGVLARGDGSAAEDAERRTPRSANVLGTIAAGALFAALAWALLSTPLDAPRLAAAALTGAREVGIANPVTAVLLDFRGYDTLLEVAVLLLAVMGVMALRSGAPVSVASHAADPLVRLLVGSLAPAVLLAAAYLVWAGTSSPGGAFQSGALLGAGVIVLGLEGMLQPMRVHPGASRLLLAAGLLAFVAAALEPVAAGRALLQYAPYARKGVILAVEGILALSIATTVAGLFLASSVTPDRGKAGRP